MPNIVDRFDSFWEYLEAVQAPSHLPEEARGSRERGPSMVAFTGTKSFEEALELAKWGWPEGVKLIEFSRLEIDSKLRTMLPQRVMTRDVTGGAVDVAAHLMGVPESMMRYEEDERPKQLVKITANMTTASGVSTSVIQTRGAAIIALVDALERLDFGTELQVQFGSRGYYSRRYALIQLKRPGEHYSIEQVAFALSHPSMQRRLDFSLRETKGPAFVQDFGARVGGGYGSPIPLPTEYAGDIHLPEATYRDGRWKSPEAALEWVLEELERLGVAVGGD